MHFVWVNYKDFNWIMHSLSQLQLFKLEWAHSEPITTISTGMRIVWANLEWNKHNLSQLHLFQVQYAQSEPIATTSTGTHIAWANQLQ